MRLSEYERKVLLDSPIYQKYAATAWSSLTAATIKADLEAIPKVSLENLPLIKFLSALYEDFKIGTTYTANQMQTKVHQNQANTTGILDHKTIEMGDRTATTHIHDAVYSVEATSITLSSGALANTVLRSATATTKCSIAWFILYWDTAPGTAYQLAFQDEDDTALMPTIHVLPSDYGKKFWIYLDTTLVDKDLEVDVSAGAGAEVLTLIHNGCNW